MTNLNKNEDTMIIEDEQTTGNGGGAVTPIQHADTKKTSWAVAGVFVLVLAVALVAFFSN